MFLGKTLNSHSASLHPGVYKWVSVNCWGKPHNLRGNDLRWTSILSRGSRNTPSHFMLQKPGISSGSYGPLGSKGFIFFMTAITSIIMSPFIATVGHVLPCQSKTAALNILTEEHCNKQTLLELYLQPSRCQHGVKILWREKKITKMPLRKDYNFVIKS